MTDKKVVVVDTGVANRHSVRNALEFIGCEVTVTHAPADIVSASKLIFPGVGSFAAGMEAIRQRGLVEPLTEAVMDRGVPVLGICLGFQLMAEMSEEDGEQTGLGWIPGRVRKIVAVDNDLKVPHVGFNNVSHRSESVLFRSLPQESDFYFLHSYRMEVGDGYVSGRCEYGGEFVAAIETRNILGTQFHPEKSQTVGLQLLRNFAEWIPETC